MVAVPRMKLGSQGLEVAALGLGCMGMSAYYGPPKPEPDMVALIHHAVAAGVTLLDTSDIYGPHTNELLLGKVGYFTIATRRVPWLPARGCLTGPSSPCDKAGAAGRGEGEGPVGHEIRHHDSQGGPRRPGVRAGGVRGQPRSARRRLHRPLLPAPH